jgi:hypothetical protein
MDDRTTYRDTVTLRRANGRIYCALDGTAEAVPVRVAWARPLTGAGEEIAFLDEKKKTVATIASPAALDPASRAIAEEELAYRYFIPRITRVASAAAHFGLLFWEVETDKGPLSFTMRASHKNAVRLGDGALVLLDGLGNRYRIDSVDALDERSRREIGKVL